MIVVDTDVQASFWIRTRRTELALEARRRDPEWVAPLLWRSEFRSVLRQYIVADLLSLPDAVAVAERAERSMRGREYAVSTDSVLAIAARTGHSSYDCEYVALAEAIGVPLLTGDKKLADRFPDCAILLEAFVAS